MVQEITFQLNGELVTVSIDPTMRLLDMIRDVCGLTGTKEGCSEGECGACTVLIDGAPAASCILMAGQVQGRNVTTVEGLDQFELGRKLQDCFVQAGAVQCGFCTPGMLLSAKALLDVNPHPNPEEIKRALSGNLCRCTGYKKIVEAVQAAAGKEDA